MNISIVTPHYNDLPGLKNIYDCLKAQSVDLWEWVIVDDASDDPVRESLRDWHRSLNDKKVQVEFNTTKSNASVCRNIGVKKSANSNLVFLDADDTITSEFVANRQIEFKDFAVFQNYLVVDKHGSKERSEVVEGDYLSHFLSARFIWQTTSVLWDKSFFKKIGQFNSELPRLQDVELMIRALQNSSNYKILNSEADFSYHVKPIRERKNFLKPVCDAVYLFVSELLDTEKLSEHQVNLIKGYYYLCAKYMERSGSTKELNLVQRNLTLFYKKGYIGLPGIIAGGLLLQLYKRNWISAELFLKANRKLFKPSVKAGKKK